MYWMYQGLILNNSKHSLESDEKNNHIKWTESENSSDAVTRAPTNVSESNAAKIIYEEKELVQLKRKSEWQKSNSVKKNKNK